MDQPDQLAGGQARVAALAHSPISLIPYFSLPAEKMPPSLQAVTR